MTSEKARTVDRARSESALPVCSDSTVASSKGDVAQVQDMSHLLFSENIMAKDLTNGKYILVAHAWQAHRPRVRSVLD